MTAIVWKQMAGKYILCEQQGSRPFINLLVLDKIDLNFKKYYCRESGTLPNDKIGHSPWNHNNCKYVCDK